MWDVPEPTEPPGRPHPHYSLRFLVCVINILSPVKRWLFAASGLLPTMNQVQQRKHKIIMSCQSSPLCILTAAAKGAIRRRHRFLQGVVKWKGEESRLNANYRSWDPVAAQRGERSRWWVVCLPTLSCEINSHFGFHKMRADDIQSFIFQPTSLPPA